MSFAITKTTNVIVSVVTFRENPYDGDTLKDTLDFHERITGIRTKEAAVDRGYRGRKIVDGTLIYTPTSPNKNDSGYKKRQARIRFRRRAAIEPIFGHTKFDYRMVRNYLKHFAGDEINALLAASAFNFRRWLRKVKLLPDFLFEWVARYLLRAGLLRFLGLSMNNRVIIKTSASSLPGNLNLEFDFELTF